MDLTPYYRDTSSIEAYGDCPVITDDQTIDVYSSISVPANQTVTTFKLIGNKYVISKVDHLSESRPPDYIQCQAYEMINTLPMRYDFMIPIYFSLSILMSLAIFYAAYKLIVYPFFRRSL